MCIDNVKRLPQTVLIISPDMQSCPDQDISGHLTFCLAHAQLYVAALPPQFSVIARNPLAEEAACVTAADLLLVQHSRRLAMLHGLI